MSNNCSQFALPVGWTLSSGTRTYTICKFLGQGGFGITYLAETPVEVAGMNVKARVAVKEHFVKSCSERDASTNRVTIFSTQKEMVAGSRRDFKSEALRLQRVGVSHTNIVKISEVFDANDTSYYVMEYLEGQSLGEYVRHNGRLTESQALAFIKPIISAVAMLHENKITHLDIKPDNIMLERRPDGVRPVLIDFGLSKHYDENGLATSTINTEGYSAGYAPIEQHSGVKKFMPMADVYALGAVLYFALTGERPPISTDRQGDDDIAPALTHVSPELRAIILRAMAVFASGRYQNARQMLNALAGGEDTIVADSDNTITIQRPKPNPKTPANVGRVSLGNSSCFKRPCLAMQTGTDLIIYYVLAAFGILISWSNILNIWSLGCDKWLFLCGLTLILLILTPLCRSRYVKVILAALVLVQPMLFNGGYLVMKIHRVIEYCGFFTSLVVALIYVIVRSRDRYSLKELYGVGSILAISHVFLGMSTFAYRVIAAHSMTCDKSITGPTVILFPIYAIVGFILPLLRDKSARASGSIVLLIAAYFAAFPSIEMILVFLPWTVLSIIIAFKRK